MFLVATVDRNWAIGKTGRLLYEIPVDAANFREQTSRNNVVYGRKSFEAIQHGVAPEGRHTIILTRDANYTCDGATVIHDISELERFPSNSIYIAGGASIYQQLYSRCKYAMITYVDSVILDSDAFFPNLNNDSNWMQLYSGPTLYYQGLPYQFIIYLNKAVD